MQRILVTGGAGFIGSHLVERLLRDGKSVTVIDDCSTGAEANLAAVAGHPNFRFVPGRVSECCDLDQIVGGSDAIYHLAAVVGVDLVMTSGIRTIETNLVETQAILEAASKGKVPTLLTSTSEVYGKSSKEEFSEEDDLLIGPPTLSRWSYACSKLMDEFLALAHAKERALPVTVVRLFNTVGPRQTGNYGMVLPRFIQAARRNLPIQIHGDGRQTRCFCYVDDTVEALVRLQEATSTRNEIFNVGSSEEVTILQLAEEIVRLLQSKSVLHFVPYEKAYGAGFEDMLRRKPRIKKLERVTGFRPKIALAEIIRRTAQAMD